MRGVAHRLPWAQIRALWGARELPVEEIGRRFGVEGRVIRRAAQAFGWNPRRMIVPARKIEPRTAMAMWHAGLPYEDIARHFGASRRAVKQFFHRRGMRRKKGWRPSARLADWPQLRMLQRMSGVAARETALEQALRLNRPLRLVS